MLLNVRIDTKSTGDVEQRRLVLSGLRWTGVAGAVAKPKPPTGTGVEALRAIWNSPYHYRVGKPDKAERYR